MDCHRPWIGGLLSSPTGLPSLQLCHLLPEMSGDMMQGDSSAGATWTSTRTLTQEQQEVSFHENNIGCKMTREEDSFLPFPCQVKHKNYWGEKTGWSTSGDNQQTARDREGAFPSRQLLADLDGLKHTLFCKGTHMLSVYQSYNGIPYMGVFPTNIKEMSWGHGLTRKRL